MREFTTLNQLLKAYTLFEKDIEYVVMDNKVKIVDEQTGRIMDGRRYSDGLHQAIEAKEGVKIEKASQIRQNKKQILLLHPFHVCPKTYIFQKNNRWLLLKKKVPFVRKC